MWLEIGQQLREGRDPVGLGCSIHPSARLSRCVLEKLGSWGQGLRLGHHHRWYKGCKYECGQMVGVAADSLGWSDPVHIGSRHSMADWR